MDDEEDNVLLYQQVSDTSRALFGETEGKSVQFFLLLGECIMVKLIDVFS